VSKFLVTDSFGTLGDGLCRASGIDPRYVRRLVLDLEVGSPGRLYVETFADSEVLDVNLADSGIKVTDAPDA
jgi:hypothetical protein